MRVYLDMDGVLVDFHTAYCADLGVPNPYRPVNRAPGDWDMLKVIQREFAVDTPVTCFDNSDFWRDMSWTHNGRDIFNTVYEACKLYGVPLALLTHAWGEYPGTFTGKVRWKQRHIPKDVPIIVTSDTKQAYVGALIDDADHHVAGFTHRPGNSAFLIPRPWNRMHASESSFDPKSLDLFVWNASLLKMQQVFP